MIKFCITSDTIEDRGLKDLIWFIGHTHLNVFFVKSEKMTKKLICLWVNWDHLQFLHTNYILRPIHKISIKNTKLVETRFLKNLLSMALIFPPLNAVSKSKISHQNWISVLFWNSIFENDIKWKSNYFFFNQNVFTYSKIDFFTFLQHYKL